METGPDFVQAFNGGKRGTRGASLAARIASVFETLEPFGLNRRDEI